MNNIQITISPIVAYTFIIILTTNHSLLALEPADTDTQTPERADSIMLGDLPPEYLKGRGEGIPTSMFGTYICAKELLVYLYFEYYYDSNMEYKPSEMGFGLDRDFRGAYRASEGLIFLGYGFSERVAIELEMAVITAELRKAKDDTSNMPDTLTESGLGDVESQIRWRWFDETHRRPELFGFFETVFPLQKHRRLIGTSDWEFALGSGIVKGFKWGTVTGRFAAMYERVEGKIEFGEYAVEYLKRISKALCIAALVEGEEDEVELILDIQWHLRPWMVAKINSGFGLTSKATDFAPELGIMFSF